MEQRQKSALELAMADYALDHVPPNDRSSFWSLTAVLTGAFVSTFSFTTGAAIANGLPLWKTLIAVLVGGILIQCVLMILCGIIGSRTGLPTGYLTRWLGFGNYGSILPSAIIGLAVFGWFTYGIAIMGHILVVLTNQGLSEPVAAVISGIALTAISTFGYKGLDKVAKIAVPLFAITMIWGLAKVFQEVGGWQAAAALTPPSSISMMQGIMLATGLFVCGSILNADVCRYAKTDAHVTGSCIIAAVAGLVLTVVAGAVMCLATGQWDPVALIVKYTGALGAVFLALITLTTADYDLYLTDLYVANIYGLFRPREEAMNRRAIMNAIIGAIATVIAATGILNTFGQWLLAMATYMPAIGGVMIGFFFVAYRARRINFNVLPRAVNWVGIVAYVVGTAVGIVTMKLNWGIPAVSAIVVAFVISAAFGRFAIGDVASPLEAPLSGDSARV